MSGKRVLFALFSYRTLLFKIIFLVDPDQVDQPNLNRVFSIHKKYMSPATARLSMISSSLAALDITKYLGEFGKALLLGKRLGYWSHNMAITTRNCNKEMFRSERKRSKISSGMNVKQDVGIYCYGCRY